MAADHSTLWTAGHERKEEKPCSGCGSVETCRKARGKSPCEDVPCGGRTAGANKHGECSAQ